jgi:hypothetical protein
MYIRWNDLWLHWWLENEWNHDLDFGTNLRRFAEFWHDWEEAA